MLIRNDYELTLISVLPGQWMQAGEPNKRQSEICFRSMYKLDRNASRIRYKFQLFFRFQRRRQLLHPIPGDDACLVFAQRSRLSLQEVRGALQGR